MAGILDQLMGLFGGAPAGANPLSNQLIPGMDFLNPPAGLQQYPGALDTAFPLAPQMVNQPMNEAPESILNPTGVYDPAVGNALASGEFGPVVDQLASQGVAPPSGGSPASGAASGLGGVLSGLRGVTAPPAPTFPRVDTPPPPRNINATDMGIVPGLLARLQGGVPGALRLGQTGPR